MRWDEDHESPDLIDRRGDGPAVDVGGGLGGGLFWLLPWLLRSPLGWVVLVVVVAVALFQGVSRGFVGSRAADPVGGSHVDDAPAHFVAFVLDDTQRVWSRELAAHNRPYHNAKLVLFSGATRTGCGFGRAATGPFYCPEDEHVYIDLSFYRELEQRLGARGEFAKAYVIAHEIGHHVQHLSGAHVGAHAEGANGASVRLELQADCYAGIWAHSTAQRDLLQSGDIESALGAASAIGDDRLQKQATGTVRPESFTHGTSEQRVRWFKRGFDTGNLEACDTFAARAL